MALVVLAMSGGVDSSVAAHLLLQAGHEVVGVFMRHGSQPSVACQTAAASQLPILPQVSDPPFHKQGCCTAEDAEDARRVAERLGIDFYALNLQQDFDRIMQYFTDEYVGGRTPNPCVICNHWIKFGRLFDYADSIGAEYVASGHYAALQPCSGETALLRGRDAAKDQSYVLFGIDRALLGRMALPIGRFEKREIRDLARGLGLKVAEKRDSQEICFVSPGQHADFVARQKGDVDTSGQLVTTTGEVVGTHAGIERFTIGQRKGLGVALGEPRYVVRIEADTCQVVVGTREELARTTLTASSANWLVDPPASGEWSVQIRYNSPAQSGTVEQLSADRFAVEFAEPCQGVAPGQAVVCYDGNRVLGGGWID